MSKEVTISRPQRKQRSKKPAVILPPYTTTESQPSSLRETLHAGVSFSSKPVHTSQHVQDSLSFVFDEQHQRAFRAETTDIMTSVGSKKQEPIRHMSYADMVRKGKNK